MQGIFILLAPRPPDETACLDMRIAWIEDMDEIADFIYDIAVIGPFRIRAKSEKTGKARYAKSAVGKEKALTSG